MDQYHKISIELDKYDGEYLLLIGVTRPGKAGNSMELPIRKEDWIALEEMGFTNLRKDEE